MTVRPIEGSAKLGYQRFAKGLISARAAGTELNCFELVRVFDFLVPAFFLQTYGVGAKLGNLCRITLPAGVIGS